MLRCMTHNIQLFIFSLLALQVACGPDDVCKGSKYNLENGLCVYSSDRLSKEILNETILVQNVLVTGDDVVFNNTASLTFVDYLPPQSDKELNGLTVIENSETFEIKIEKQDKCYKELSTFVHEYMHTLLTVIGKEQESADHSSKYFNNSTNWFDPNLEDTHDNVESAVLWEVYQMCGEQKLYEPGSIEVLDNGTIVQH